MIKLTASFSKKVPVPGSDYSSQQYHAAVEVELPDGLTLEQLQGRIHQTFSLVQASVEHELGNDRQDSADSPAAFTPAPPPAANGHAPNGRSEGNGARATGKQIQFITNLGLRNKLSLQALNDLALRTFGAADLAVLTRKQASDFIEHFDSLVQPGRRAA